MERFDALAGQPLAWHETAASFIVAANYLVRMEAESTPAGFTWSNSGSNWPILLLYATAAENLLKAIRIAQGEPVVKDGKLASYFCSHNLRTYAADAGLMLDDQEQELLATLEDVLAAGKYPVAKQAGKNLRAWTFEYPADLEIVWRLLQRFDSALRATGTKCLAPFEVGKLRKA
jgi:hypothetical protein